MDGMDGMVPGWGEVSNQHSNPTRIQQQLVEIAHSSVLLLGQAQVENLRQVQNVCNNTKLVLFMYIFYV